MHPACDFGDPSQFGDLDPEGQYVVSTRIRCGRSVQGFPFNPNMTEAQYSELEALVSSTLQVGIISDDDINIALAENEWRPSGSLLSTDWDVQVGPTAAH